MSGGTVLVPDTTRAQSALVRDFTTRGGSIAGLGDFRAGSADWTRVLAARAPLDGILVDALVSYNREIGVAPDVCEALRGLAAVSVRAVVTGQQPGVMGGPLLSLHKAAAAVSLAAAVASRHAVECVPVFWLGSEDDDFNEARELAILGADLTVVSAEVPATAFAPGRRIGDIGAGAVRLTWQAVARFAPAPDPSLDAAAAAGDDLGDIAARALVRSTGGRVAVVDGRAPWLRDAGRDLLLAYFDREPEVHDAVANAGRRLSAAGYHEQLAAGSDSGLFLLRDGIRRRIPQDRRDVARAEFARDIQRVSPGVIARNLLQDAVLRPVAVVLGPAEIAYRAQLVDVYTRFGVEQPVVLPRMSGTFVPPPVREVAEHTGADVALLVNQPAAFVAHAHAALAEAGLADAGRRFEDAHRAEAARFLEAARGRLDARAAEKLTRRLSDVAQRLAQSVSGAMEQDAQGAAGRWPFLPRLAGAFVRDGQPQERYLSLVVPATFHGPSAWDGVRAVADAHVGDTLDGRVGHRVYWL